MELLYTLMRILFPDFCHNCGLYGNILCIKCIDKLPICRETPQANCFAALSYRDPIVRSIILSLKTRQNIKIAELLSEKIYDSTAQELAELAHIKNFLNPIIIPIPGSPEKLSHYGFNHADVLAYAFSQTITDYTPSVVTDILIKRPTKTKQAKTHGRLERFQNMATAFEITKSGQTKIHNACIILVDDVITTGATCTSARQLLLDAGARQVMCVAIAH